MTMISTQLRQGAECPRCAPPPVVQVSQDLVSKVSMYVGTQVAITGPLLAPDGSSLFHLGKETVHQCTGV